MYSADVIESHKASTSTSPERSNVTSSSQDNQPASASPDSRAVILLVPVRLGGEKTNPDYFNLAKVRQAPTLRRLKYVNVYAGIKCKFSHSEHSESGLLHRHHWREAQTGLLLCGISRLVLAQSKTERRATHCWGVKTIILHIVPLLYEETR